MGTIKFYPQVRAIHHGGTLRLLDPLELPEGAQVRLYVQFTPSDATDDTSAIELAYPTRLVSAERLDNLTGLVEVGGDALADSEALSDPDRN
ncbi:MAG: antitoxin family protein [Anaerolineae bacterium]